MLADETRQRLRRLRKDARSDPNRVPIAYEAEAGQTVEWPGDIEAPYVKIVPADEYTRLHSGATLTGAFVAKEGRGRLKRVDCYNADGALQFYLQVFDARALVLGAVPLWVPLVVLPDTTVALVFSESSTLAFSSGLVVALSTTPATFTAAGAIGVFSVQIQDALLPR
jgi:hypothetical protein